VAAVVQDMAAAETQVQTLVAIQAVAVAVDLVIVITVQHTAQAAVAALAHAECAVMLLAQQVVALAATQATHTKQAAADKVDQVELAESQANHGQTEIKTVTHVADNLAAEVAEAAPVMQAAGADLALYEFFGALTDAGLAVTHTTYNT